jgi:hypothetical protein
MVVIMLLGFATGTVCFCAGLEVGVCVADAVIVIGLITGWVLSKAGWGVNGPEYTPKAH